MTILPNFALLTRDGEILFTDLSVSKGNSTLANLAPNHARIDSGDSWPDAGNHASLLRIEVCISGPVTILRHFAMAVS